MTTSETSAAGASSAPRAGSVAGHWEQSRVPWDGPVVCWLRKLVGLPVRMCTRLTFAFDTPLVIPPQSSVSLTIPLPPNGELTGTEARKEKK